MRLQYLLAGVVGLLGSVVPAIASSCEPISKLTQDDTAAPCGSDCVHRILYRTAYSSAVIGIQETMIAFDAFAWCTSDLNKEWCPEAIDTATSTVAGNAIAEIDVDFQLCADECLVLSLAAISHKSALLALEWAHLVFAGIATEYVEDNVFKLEQMTTHLRNSTITEADLCESDNPDSTNKTTQLIRSYKQDYDNSDKKLAIALPFLAAPGLLLGPFVANEILKMHTDVEAWLLDGEILQYLRHLLAWASRALPEYDWFREMLLAGVIRTIHMPYGPPIHYFDFRRASSDGSDVTVDEGSDGSVGENSDYDSEPPLEPPTYEYTDPDDAPGPEDDDVQQSQEEESDYDLDYDSEFEDTSEPPLEPPNYEYTDPDDAPQSEIGDSQQSHDDDVIDEEGEVQPQTPDDTSEPSEDSEPTNHESEDSRPSADSETEPPKPVKDSPPVEPQPEEPEIPKIDKGIDPPPAEPPKVPNAERLYRAERYDVRTNRLVQETLREVQDLSEIKQLNHPSNFGKFKPFEQLDEEGRVVRRLWRGMDGLKPIEGEWKKVGDQLMRLDGAVDSLGEPLIASESGAMLTVAPVAGPSGTIEYLAYGAAGEVLNGGLPLELAPGSPVSPANPATPAPRPTHPHVKPHAPTDIPTKGTPLPGPGGSPVAPPPAPVPTTPVVVPPPSVRPPKVDVPHLPFHHDGDGDDDDDHDNHESSKHEGEDEKAEKEAKKEEEKARKEAEHKEAERKKAEEKAAKKEAERKEAERKEAERKADKEKKAKKEAEEKAKKEAEEKARKEREKAEKEAKEAKEKAEKEAKEAKEKAEKEAKEAKEKARKEAEEKAKEEARKSESATPTTFSTAIRPAEATAVRTGDAAPQISDLPKRCVVDGVHLKKIDDDDDRHECEHKIARLNREDARAWVEAWMPPMCWLNEDGVPLVTAAISAKEAAHENADAEKDLAKTCEDMVRNFKHEDNRKTWIAGIIPATCHYGQEKRGEKVPEDHSGKDLGKEDNKKCEAIVKSMAKFADTDDD